MSVPGLATPRLRAHSPVLQCVSCHGSPILTRLRPRGEPPNCYPRVVHNRKSDLFSIFFLLFPFYHLKQFIYFIFVLPLSIPYLMSSAVRSCGTRTTRPERGRQRSSVGPEERQWVGR